MFQIFLLLFLIDLKHINNKCLDYNSISNLCHICEYNYYNDIDELFIKDFQFDLINCKEISDFNYNITLYVNSESKSIFFSDGTENNHFNNIFEALIYGINITKKYKNLSVYIFLLGASEHFLMKKSLKNEIYYLFRRQYINIIIKPIFCFDQNITGCLKKDDFSIINIKSDNIIFFISKYMLIERIIFKGNDMHLNDDNIKFINKTICNEYNMERKINDSISEKCFLLNKLYTFNSYSSYGLFNLEFLFDCFNCSSPFLEIINCKFMNIHSFYEENKKYSIISIVFILKGLPIGISLKNTFFYNIFLIKGLINTYEFSDYFYLNTSKFNILFYFSNQLNYLRNLTINMINCTISEYNKYNINLINFENDKNCLFCFEINNFISPLNEINSSFSLNLINVIIKNNHLSEEYNFILINQVDFNYLSEILIISSYFSNNKFIKIIKTNKKIILIDIFSTIFSKNFDINFEINYNKIKFRNIYVDFLNLSVNNFIDLSFGNLFFSNCIIIDINSSYLPLTLNLIYIKTKLNESIDEIFNVKKPINKTVDILYFENSYFMYFFNIPLTSYFSSPIHDFYMYNCSISYIFIFPKKFISFYIEYSIIISQTSISRINVSDFCFLPLARNRSFFNIKFFNNSGSFIYTKVGGLANTEIGLLKFLMQNCSFINIIYNFIIYSDAIFNTNYYDLLFIDNEFQDIKVKYRKEINILIIFDHFQIALIKNIIIIDINKLEIFYLQKGEVDYFYSYMNMTCVSIIIINSIPNFIITSEYQTNFYLSDCIFVKLNDIKFEIPLINLNALLNSYFVMNNCLFFGKIGSTISTINFFFNDAKRVLIINCSFIDFSLISTGFLISFDFNQRINEIRKDISYLSVYSLIKNQFIYCSNYLIYSTNTDDCLILNNSLISYYIENINVFDLNIWVKILKNYGIVNCIFKNSYLLPISISNGELLIYNSLFYNLTTLSYYGFLNLYSSTFLILINNNFSKCVAFEESNIIFASRISTIYVKNTTFFEIKSTNGILFINLGEIYIFNTIVINIISNEGGLINGEFNFVFIKYIIVKYCFSTIFGGIINLFNSFFEIFNSNLDFLFSNNYGSVFYLEKSYYLNIENIIINNSFSLKKGNIYFIGQEGIRVNIRNITCKNSISIESTCIFSKEGDIILINSNFQSNFAIKNIISISSSFKKLNVVLIKLIISENIILKTMIYLNNANSYLESLLFIISNIYSNCLNFYFSEIVFKNTTFFILSALFNNEKKENYPYFISGYNIKTNFSFIKFNANNVYGCLYFEICSIIIDSLYFNSCYSLKGSSIKMIDSDKTFIYNSIFLNNTGFWTGSIYFSNAFITLNNCFFHGNIALSKLGSDIYGLTDFSNKNYIIILNNIYFEELNSVSCYIENLNFITLKNVYFINNNIIRESQALHFINIKLIDINLSIFYELNQLSGVYIFSKNIKDFKINLSNLVFIKCSSQNLGGGIYIEGYQFLNIEKSIFINNFAIISGGGFFYSSYKHEYNYIEITDNFFKNNTSLSYGKIFTLEALYSDNINSKLVSSNLFFINNLLDSLNLFSGLPSKLILINNTNTTIKSIHCKSGYYYHLIGLITDQFDNKLIYNNIGWFKIFAISINSTVSTNITLYGNIINNINGMGIFDKFGIFGFPGTSILCEIRFNDDYSIVSNNFSIIIEPCERGEIFFNMKCILCKEGFYSFDNNSFGNSKNSCELCPKNAYCPGKDVILPKIGYWKINNISILLIKCMTSMQCPDQYENYLESIKLNITFEYKCGKGYYGNLCKICDDNYGLEENDCLICTENAIYYLRFFGIFTISIIFLMYQSFVSLNFQINDSLQRSSIKLLINHNYYLTFLSNLNLEWSDKIKSFSSFVDKYSSSVPKEILNFECLLRNLIKKEKIVYIRIVFLSFYPVIIFFILFILRIIIFLIISIKKSKQQKIRYKDEIRTIITSCFIITVYNFYSRLTLATLQTIQCIKIDETFNEYLEIDPNIKCWTSNEHHELLIYGFIPNLIIWCIGWPLIIFISLKIKIYQTSHSKKNIEIEISKYNENQNFSIVKNDFTRENIKFTKNVFSNMKLQENEQDLNRKIKKVSISINLNPNLNTEKYFNNRSSNKIDKNVSTQISKNFYPLEETEQRIYQRNKIFKFLTIDYRIKYYYWESFFYLTNFIIASLNVSSYKMHSTTKSGLFIMLYLIMLLISEWIKPFRNNTLNNLASFSYIVTLITIGITIINVNSNNYYFQEDIYFFLMIFINVLFYAIWFAIFFRLVLYKILNDKSLSLFSKFIKKKAEKKTKFIGPFKKIKKYIE